MDNLKFSNRPVTKHFLVTSIWADPGNRQASAQRVRKQRKALPASAHKFLNVFLPKPWSIVHTVYMPMKPKLYLCCLLGLIVLGAHGQTKTSAMETATKPVTCKLTTPELQKRKATVIAELKTLVRERKELDNGYAYKFESLDQNLDKLNEFIKTERMCCDFFTFQLTVEESTAILTITGPNGAKEFLKDEVDL
jgi:hypothetical protein